jgi:hypothetical protein
MGEAVKRDLLTRLARLGPLPEDSAVSQSQLDEFGDIVDRIGAAPADPEYIRPLLAAFGYGDGFGLYTHGAHALLRQDRAAVVAAALDMAEGDRDGPRQWAVEALRRLREGDRGNPPPSDREVRAVEAAVRGPELVADSAVCWAYWVADNIPAGLRVLEIASQVAPDRVRARAAELLSESRHAEPNTATDRGS